MMDTKSTHRVEVVRVKKEPHPNADNLALVKVFDGGHTVVVNKNLWQDGDLGAYIVPDSIVPTHHEVFAFLKEKPLFDKETNKVIGKTVDYSLTHARIKVKRLRGVYSEGLLVPAPFGAKEGDDVASFLGVTRYEPPEPSSHGKGIYLGGEASEAPLIFHPKKYDIESYNRYKFLFQEGEEVIITEKIHGCNARFVFWDGKQYCGSRTEWKKEFPDYSHVTRDFLLFRGVPKDQVDERLAKIQERTKSPKRNVWWQLYRDDPSIQKFCESNPGFILYGECYGRVQDLQYGTKPGEVKFAAFDIWDAWKAQYLDFVQFSFLRQFYGVPEAPVLYMGPYSESHVNALVDGTTTVNGATHCREGIVIRPRQVRYNDRVGRVILKKVSNLYLERA